MEKNVSDLENVDREAVGGQARGVCAEGACFAESEGVVARAGRERDGRTGVFERDNLLRGEAKREARLTEHFTLDGDARDLRDEVHVVALRQKRFVFVANRSIEGIDSGDEVAPAP